MRVISSCFFLGCLTTQLGLWYYFGHQPWKVTGNLQYVALQLPLGVIGALIGEILNKSKKLEEANEETRKLYQFIGVFVPADTLNKNIQVNLELKALECMEASKKVIELQRVGMEGIGRTDPRDSFDSIRRNLEEGFKELQDSFYSMYDLAYYFRNTIVSPGWLGYREFKAYLKPKNKTA